MPAVIDRAKAAALISEQVRPAILQGAPQGSIFMSLAKKLPNMTSNVTKMPVLDMLPVSYWVTGDTGYKGVSRAGWDNVYIYAEELAVIVPIPMAVLRDADYDIIGEVKPRVIEAIYSRVDQAALFDIGRPTLWPLGIATQARNAGNNVANAGGDLYDKILGVGGVFDKVEEDDYEVTGAIGQTGLKAKLRGLRTTDGMPIFKQDIQGPTRYALDGAPLYMPGKGVVPKDKFELLAGDFKQAVYSIREDMQFDILDQAVIQDPSTKEIIFNLAQQDMIALRVYFRMGWALPNYARLGDPNRLAFPFAYLEPASPITTIDVTVKVTSDGSAPLQNAVVDLNGSRLVTDSSGSATFKLAEAGTYNLVAKLEGYKDFTKELPVTVTATETITLVKK